MTDLFAARSQMAMSLAFHMIFATIGIGMPLLMVIAEGLWLRSGEPVYRTLAKRWSKGTAILFAVGAVSGTVLSFELGLLWPGFMEYAGAVIGMPFSLEGFAFFLEAIFLGVYLYGWDRVSPRAHWWSGVGVMVSGMMSGIFVVTANAWMNAPAGFECLGEDGAVRSIEQVVAAPDPTGLCVEAVNISPLGAMFNAAAFSQCLHMTLAAFLAVGFLVAGVHASQLLKDPRNLFHRQAMAIALSVAAIFTPLQMLSGHESAVHVSEQQPIKLAAMEALWHSGPRAPLLIGGIPDEAAEENHLGVEIPWALSLLIAFDPDHEVMGLDQVPLDQRPPVAVVHIAYQIMIGAASAMAVTIGLGALVAWRRRGLPDDPRYLRLLVLVAPLGMIAIEAGWTVTEVGRQPWVVYGLMYTRDAVTPMPGLVGPFLTFTVLYLVLAVVVVALMRRQVFASPRVLEGDDDAS